MYIYIAIGTDEIFISFKEWHMKYKNIIFIWRGAPSSSPD